MRKCYIRKYCQTSQLNKEKLDYISTWLKNEDYVLYLETDGYSYDYFYTNGIKI